MDKDLDTILQGLGDKLFAESPDEDVSQVTTNDPPIFDEWIGGVLAESLVGSDKYKPENKYKIITTEDYSLVAMYDKTGTEIIEEFPLKSDEEVQSFADMHRSVAFGIKPTFDKPVIPRQRDIYTASKSNFWKIITIVFVVLFAIGVALMAYVMNL